MSDELQVQKRIAPWSKYAQMWGVNFTDVQAVYRLTASAAGLVHAAQEEHPVLDDDKYTVVLVPLGLPPKDAEPHTEMELQQAAHGLMHGLGALHAVNYVHCDLRWDNCTCSYDRANYFLLDLETCAPANAAAAKLRKDWTTATLCHGRYTPASDLYQFGRMLSKFRATVPVGDVGRSFFELLEVPAAQQQLRAVDLLQHPWIRCPGAACTAAGAQQLEC
eukprot:TRINITY_DN2615_c0_g1_i1.p1 TRINITY_DN2615_c0_g1~~TRINITY_DN2615_c0_g1_i1.p1  ORF type:complete len:220 (-),score=57.00 TRINITY_DN2615_c0_g1_i1:168-827(-)